MLRKVVGESHDALEGAATGGGLSTPSRSRTFSAVSVDTSASASGPGSAGAHRTSAHSPSHPAGWGIGAAKTTLYTVPGVPESIVVRPEFPVNIEAADLKLLLQKRPELVEFLHLEIEQMKLETERLTNME